MGDYVLDTEQSFLYYLPMNWKRKFKRDFRMHVVLAIILALIALILGIKL
jgi:hypothetical protein